MLKKVIGTAGQGSKATELDYSYAEWSWLHRVSVSGGAGGGYEGGTTGDENARQDRVAYSGTSFWNEEITSDTTAYRRNTSCIMDFSNSTKGAILEDGHIRLTLEHEHNYQPIGQTTATCTQGGERTERCTICGDEITRTIPALGHLVPPNNPYVYTYATNNGVNKGVRYGHCSRCNQVLETAYLVSLNKGTGIASVTEGGYYRKGQSVTVNATLVAGYTWKNWTGTLTSTNQNFTFTMPEKAVTLTANANNPQYRVNHYQQNLSDYGYTLKDTEILSAPLGTEVQPNVKTYTGYISPPKQKVTIESNNSTVVNYYYKLMPPTVENNIQITATVEAGYIEETTNIPVLTREDGVVTYNIKYISDIERYIGKAKVEIVTLLPENIDIEKSNLAGGTYNEKAHTITWIQEIKNVDTTETGKYRVEVEKQIGIVYKNQDVIKDLVAEVGGKIITYYPEEFEERPGQELIKKTATDSTIVKQEYKTNYKVQKIWEDSDNVEGKRPESVTIKILIMPQNKVVTKILNDENNWTYEERGLPKYVKETGERIVYSVTESETNKGDLEYYEDNPTITKTEDQTNEAINYLYKITNKYRTIKTGIETEITKTGPEEITSSKDKLDYTINFKAEITDYIGGGIVKLVDELPYEIDEEKSELNGGKYDKETKTITWEEELEHINTFEKKAKLTSFLASIASKDTTNPNVYKIDITKKIKLVYKDIDLTQEKMTNNVKGGVKLEYKGVKDETTEGADTNINVEGTVKVKYVDKHTNKEILKIGKDDVQTDVEDSITRSSDETYGYEITDKVGTEYQTQMKKIENYNYIESTNNEKGKIEEGEIEVIYYYEKMVYDFSINKTIEKITLNGQNIEISDNSLAKVEIKTSEVENAELIISYNIEVTNQEEIAGIAKILETLPTGCEIQQMPEYWKQNNDGTLKAEIELESKETKNLKLTLRWNNNESNLGSKTNKVKVLNPEELDNNSNINLGDYTSDATVIISIKTGQVVSAIIIIMIIGALGICGYIAVKVLGRKGPNIRRIRFLYK